MQSEATEDDVASFTKSLDALGTAAASSRDGMMLAMGVNIEPGLETGGQQNKEDALELDMKQIRAKAEQCTDARAHNYQEGIKTDIDSVAKKLKKFYGVSEKIQTEPNAIDKLKIPEVIQSKTAHGRGHGAARLGCEVLALDWRQHKKKSCFVAQLLARQGRTENCIVSGLAIFLSF